MRKIAYIDVSGSISNSQLERFISLIKFLKIKYFRLFSIKLETKVLPVSKLDLKFIRSKPWGGHTDLNWMKKIDLNKIDPYIFWDGKADYNTIGCNHIILTRDK